MLASGQVLAIRKTHGACFIALGSCGVIYTLTACIVAFRKFGVFTVFKSASASSGDFSRIQHIICLALHYHLPAEMYFVFGSTPWLFLGLKRMQSLFFRHFRYSRDLAYFSKTK